MKKALSYMIIGAVTYGAIDMWLCNRNEINKQFKKMKKNGMEAYNKVKAIF